MITAVTAPHAPPSSHPGYYERSAMGNFSAAALLYSCLAHIWVFGFRRQKRQISLQPLQIPRKTAVITGTSQGGIGLEVAKSLVVDCGWEVVLACRSKEKALAAQREIELAQVDSNLNETRGKAVVLDVPLDLSSMKSVSDYSKELSSKYESIDVLVNNAGLNTDGKCGKLNLIFQANFLGHFALTKALLDKLKDGGRVVNLSSVMHHFAGSKEKDEQWWRSMSLFQDPKLPETYSASKLAALLFSLELNRRYSSSHKIRSVAVNPGAVASDIWRSKPRWLRWIYRRLYLTPKQGASTTLAAVIQPDLGDIEYIQPYWQRNSGVPHPITEMMGPYIGWKATKPRLPSDGGKAAGSALWKVCEELSETNVQI